MRVRGKHEWMALLLAAILFLMPGVSMAEVFVNAEKPADWESRDLMRVTVAEFPSNDAFIIQQGGYNMLVDGGAVKYKARLAAWLEKNNLKDMDIVFNSHPHDDHLQAVCVMLLLEEIRPKQFISPFPETYGNALQQKTVNRLKERNVPYVQVKNEDVFTLGDVQFTVYQYEKGDDPNELSGVLMVRYHDATMLLTADLPGEAQNWLMDRYPDQIHADILKVPHHGLVNMVLNFTQTVNPEFAFVTHRPKSTEKVNRQLEKAGIPYLHHSRGTIIMETDGTDWYVTQETGVF